MRRLCSGKGRRWEARWGAVAVIQVRDRGGDGGKAVTFLIALKVEPTGFPDRFDVGCAEIEQSRTT